MGEKEETYIAYEWDSQLQRLVRKEFPKASRRYAQYHRELERKIERSKRKQRLGGQARKNQINRLAQRDGWFCRWCDIELSLNTASIDHYPISKAEGGDNTDDNAVLSCRPCNVDRSAGRAGRLRIEERKAWVQRSRKSATPVTDSSQKFTP